MRVKTFARVRGRDKDEEPETCLQANEKDATIIIESKRKVEHFTFDKVFGQETEQGEIFKEVVEPLVAASLKGINGTVFAYGQTGSGKTYSITGGATYDSRGIIPRAIARVFEDPDLLQCSVSYVEVYNEDILDLMDNRKKVPLYATHGIECNGNAGARFLKNLKVQDVSSEEDALDLFFRGNMARTTGSTLLNMSSSRSHCLFTMEVRTAKHMSCLHFVDLAGSERMQDKTSKHINLSLHFLEQVVMNLQSQSDHVSFRNSTMTALLRESLGGNSRTVFLITLNPDVDQRIETLSSCRFAQRCRTLSTNVTRNESLEQKVVRLEKENEELRGELAIAFNGLQEHNKIRDMLDELLQQMDQDAINQIKTEVSFLNGIDAQVDTRDELLMLFDNTAFQAIQIPKEYITAIERNHSDNGVSVFRLHGANSKKNKVSVFAELHYTNDASMMEQVVWLQALEHWLGPEIPYEEKQSTSSIPKQVIRLSADEKESLIEDQIHDEDKESFKPSSGIPSETSKEIGNHANLDAAAASVEEKESQPDVAPLSIQSTPPYTSRPRHPSTVSLLPPKIPDRQKRRSSFNSARTMGAMGLLKKSISRLKRRSQSVVV